MAARVFGVRRLIRSTSFLSQNSGNGGVFVDANLPSIVVWIGFGYCSNFCCRGHYSDAVLSSLESQNDTEVEGITAKVKMLKDVSISQSAITPPRIKADKPQFYTHVLISTLF